MKLGQCPICKKPIEIYKSLDIDGWKRYDTKCNTKGCLINEQEWNYEDKGKLVRLIKRSQELSGVSKQEKPKKKNNELKVHYHWRKEKTACGHGDRMTKKPEEVTCGLCLKHKNFKNDFGLP